jgi:hypothetical protein
MIADELAISRFRRDLTISALLRTALLFGATICVVAGPMLGYSSDGTLLLVVIVGIWIVLSYQSARGSRLAADSPSLIAAGEYDRAEGHINDALRSFSLFRTAKLMSLHHLALLRHAQRRWRESGLLSQAILSQKLKGLPGLARSSLLLLTDSMLKTGDLRGAFDAMNGVYRYRLTLGEALTLQLLQLDYGARIEAWEPMVQSVGLKVQFAELMPGANAARAQALLALAANKTGRVQLAQWLRRRCELLADPADIVADRPWLAEMFGQGA